MLLRTREAGGPNHLSTAMNVVREIQRLNEKELARGTTSGSWHDQYKDSAWVYVGNMPFELTEGDVICVMSQWGEVSHSLMLRTLGATRITDGGYRVSVFQQIEDLHLVRDKDTGKSKGFAFVKYENQKSTILAVDNFNGVTVRAIRRPSGGRLPARG